MTLHMVALYTSLALHLQQNHYTTYIYGEFDMIYVLLTYYMDFILTILHINFMKMSRSKSLISSNR